MASDYCINIALILVLSSVVVIPVKHQAILDHGLLFAQVHLRITCYYYIKQTMQKLFPFVKTSRVPSVVAKNMIHNRWPDINHLLQSNTIAHRTFFYNLNFSMFGVYMYRTVRKIVVIKFLQEQNFNFWYFACHSIGFETK